MTKVIEASYFDPFLELAALKFGENAKLHLAIIPQEGEMAGRVSYSPSALEDPDPNVNDEVAGILEGKEKIRSNTWKKFGKIFWAISGEFDSVIGIIWIEEETGATYDERVITYIVEFIETAMATSKQSYFHNIFSAQLFNFELSDIYEKLAEAIRHGLFCDYVIIWKVSGSLLKTMYPNEDFAVPIDSSVAGGACKEGTKIISNFDDFDKSKIYLLEFLEDNELNSAFFIPIGLSEEPQGNSDGVVGVFYHRRYGTTSIDRMLCEYAVNYYEILWKQKNIIDAAQLELVEFRSTGPFYRDAVKALADFHDLNTIQLGLSSSVSSAKSLAYNRDDIDAYLTVAENCASQLNELVKNHRNALTIAPDMKELLGSEEGENFSQVDVADLIRQELQKFEQEAKNLRCQIIPKFNLNNRYYRVRKKDLIKLVSNLVSNSMRAMRSRQQGGGKIYVSARAISGALELTVRDDGPGIQKEDQERVWDIHYTTHRHDGGRGIGLSVVKAIANKSGFDPRLESTWGAGTEISVQLALRERASD